MDKTQALQNLLNGTATEDEINLLKGGLASGEISIGGNVNQSVIIIGSGNTVELPPAALDRLGGRSLLGDLDRDLTGDEIASGLNRLEVELPQRAPVLLTQFQEQTRRLRPSLKTNVKSLSGHARKERMEALAQINSLCMEALDISFSALCLGEEPPEYDSRSPFRGLESFRPEDSEFFFGREALTKKLVAKIQSHPFLAVLGASGSGKSSLVMAGLIPALGSEYIIFRPGTNPLEALETVKENAFVVVDQFEELFTLTRDETTRKEFITKLLETTKQNKVVITLRSDFLGEVAEHRTLNEEVQSHLENVPPMDMDELRRAMEAQANQVGLRFEADLSQQILDDVEGEPGAMPLLQHALWELWNRRHGRNLRASEYRAFGGVKQAITSTAEKIYGECTKAEQEQIRDIFLRLTRLDDSDEERDTRRRVAMSDLISSEQDVASITLLLNKLADARLIVKTVNEDKTEIEVAHEALIRHWERLRGWLNEDRDNLRLRESVSEDAKEWENADRDETLLNHRGGRLDDALSLKENFRYGLTEIEQVYLKACVSLRNKEQRERERRLRWTVIASIAAAVIFLMLGSFGLVKSNEATSQAATAQSNANIALARQLAAQGQIIFNGKDSKQQTAVLLAIQSLRMFSSREAAQILQNNTLAKQVDYPVIHNDNVVSIAFSLDGKYMVSGACNQHDSGNNYCIKGSVQVWSTDTGVEIASMTRNSSGGSVAFSPDAKYVASGGSDGIVRVWEVTTRKEISHMMHDSHVFFVAYSPNGIYVISGSRDGAVHVWTAKSGKEITRVVHEGGVSSVALSPDGKYVVSGGCDDQLDFSQYCTQGSARLWEVDTGKEIFRIMYGGGVSSVAFSPDGRYVVSGGCDEQESQYQLCTQGSTRIWEVDSRQEITRMIHDGKVTSVDFSPNSKYVVSGSEDATARVWEVITGKETARMTHDSYVWSVAFSPNGKYVISGSVDGTARVWEASTGKEIVHMMHDVGVISVAFSPDSKYVVSKGNAARLWKVDLRQEIVRMKHKGAVNSVAFSPDGRYVASGSEDGTMGVWDIYTGQEITRMLHDDSVTSVAFSPNSKYIVSGSMDGIARTWEITSGKEIARATYDVWVLSVAFSLDGKYVVSGGCDQQEDSTKYCTQGSARVWEAETGTEISRVTDNAGINSVAFSPDSKYAVSGSYVESSTPIGTAHVWEVISGKEISRFALNGHVLSVTFSPDGKYVVSSSYDNTARVWEAATGIEIARMTHDFWVFSVAFSPDSKYVVSGGCDLMGSYSPCIRGSARVWETTTGKEISRMTYDGFVDSVVFSPDGKYVASGSSDNTAGVWEAATGKEISRMTHDSWVLSVAFSPDGRYVVSGSKDGTARMWIYRPDDLIAEACSRVIRNLTRVEWTQYIGDALPYQAVCPNLPIEPEPTPTP